MGSAGGGPASFLANLRSAFGQPPTDDHRRAKIYLAAMFVSYVVALLLIALPYRAA